MGSSAAGLCIHCTATEAEKCKWRGGNWPQPQRERPLAVVHSDIDE